ncbi:peritrophin-1-like [Argonauta hians]
MVCDYEWRVPECRSRTCSPSTRDPNEPCPARPPVIHKDPSCVQIQTKLLSTRSLSDIVPDVRCRSKFDIYPNPGHNSSYILCLDYQAVIKHCPPHLIFDSQKNRCDWPFLSI